MQPPAIDFIASQLLSGTVLLESDYLFCVLWGVMQRGAY
jgi:hypothetical protein